MINEINFIKHMYIIIIFMIIKITLKIKLYKYECLIENRRNNKKKLLLLLTNHCCYIVMKSTEVQTLSTI